MTQGECKIEIEAAERHDVLRHPAMNEMVDEDPASCSSSDVEEYATDEERAAEDEDDGRCDRDDDGRNEYSDSPDDSDITEDVWDDWRCVRCGAPRACDGWDVSRETDPLPICFRCARTLDGGDRQPASPDPGPAFGCATRSATDRDGDPEPPPNKRARLAVPDAGDRPDSPHEPVGMCPLASLTDETIVAVLALLDARDLLACRAVCREWKRRAEADELWDARASRLSAPDVLDPGAWATCARLTARWPGHRFRASHGDGDGSEGGGRSYNRAPSRAGDAGFRLTAFEVCAIFRSLRRPVLATRGLRPHLFVRPGGGVARGGYASVGTALSVPGARPEPMAATTQRCGLAPVVLLDTSTPAGDSVAGIGGDGQRHDAVADAVPRGGMWYRARAIVRSVAREGRGRVARFLAGADGILPRAAQRSRVTDAASIHVWSADEGGGYARAGGEEPDLVVWLRSRPRPFLGETTSATRWWGGSSRHDRARGIGAVAVFVMPERVPCAALAAFIRAHRCTPELDAACSAAARGPPGTMVHSAVYVQGSEILAARELAAPGVVARGAGFRVVALVRAEPGPDGRDPPVGGYLPSLAGRVGRRRASDALRSRWRRRLSPARPRRFGWGSRARRRRIGARTD